MIYTSYNPGNILKEKTEEGKLNSVEELYSKCGKTLCSVVSLEGINTKVVSVRVQAYKKDVSFRLLGGPKLNRVTLLFFVYLRLYMCLFFLTVEHGVHVIHNGERARCPFY